jgi:hypothetical protein
MHARLKNLIVSSAIHVLFLIATFAVVQAQEVVTRGPYLQQLSHGSVIVRWRSDIAVGSAVRYGSSPSTLTELQQSSTATTEHSVTLSGLSAATRYYYTVGSPTSVSLTGDSDHSFKTAPSPGTATQTRFWVIGDSGTANANAAAVRDRYLDYSDASKRADFFIMLGDNAYNIGTDNEYQAAVFDMYPEILMQTPLWSTLGNHDGITASSATQTGPYYDIHTFPKFAEAGGIASGTEAYYSFDYGNIHFICLNSYDINRTSAGAMMQWLEADLMANNKEWLIAFWHHPPYTKGSHDSDIENELIEMRQNALPLLEQYGVDLVLSGHSHSYERSYFLNGHYDISSTLSLGMLIDSGDGTPTGDGAYSKVSGQVAGNRGAVYAVAGSSGQATGGALNHPAMHISLNALGSMVIDVDGTELRAIFLDDAGIERDAFTILHKSDETKPEIVSVETPNANTIRVTFSENMLETSVESLTNYSIEDGISISSAVLQSDNRTVELSVSSLIENRAYALYAPAVKDLSNNAAGAKNGSAVFSYITNGIVTFKKGVSPTAAYVGMIDTDLSEQNPTANTSGITALRIDGDEPVSSGTRSRCASTLGSCRASSKWRNCYCSDNLVSSD